MSSGTDSGYVFCSFEWTTFFWIFWSLFFVVLIEIWAFEQRTPFPVFADSFFGGKSTLLSNYLYIFLIFKINLKWKQDFVRFFSEHASFWASVCIFWFPIYTVAFQCFTFLKSFFTPSPQCLRWYIVWLHLYPLTPVCKLLSLQLSQASPTDFPFLKFKLHHFT